MIYVVLGMHKSGTTLVSRLLHHAGIPMVDEVDASSYDGGNKYERGTVQRINDALLGSEGTESLHIPPRTPRRVPEAQRAAMRSFIATQQSTDGDWGFKDPRTCLTYPVWADVLPPHRLVAVVRSPHEIWRRYRPKRRRDLLLEPLFAWRFVRSWVKHNDMILAALDRHHRDDAIVFEFGALVSQATERERLASFLGRPLTNEVRPELYRSRVDRNRTVGLAAAAYRLVYGRKPSDVYGELVARSVGSHDRDADDRAGRPSPTADTLRG